MHMSWMGIEPSRQRVSEMHTERIRQVTLSLVRIKPELQPTV